MFITGPLLKFVDTYFRAAHAIRSDQDVKILANLLLGEKHRAQKRKREKIKPIAATILGSAPTPLRPMPTNVMLVELGK